MRSEKNIAGVPLLISLVLPGAVFAEPAATPARRPNVVILMCDQLTAAALSCYGGPVATPHIDRIAREGVQFNQAVCPTPYCSPTRASVITGMYPHSHGIVLNCSPHRQRGITPEDLTSEKILNADGYATHHCGKWHLFGDKLPYYPDMYEPDPPYTRDMADTFARVRQSDPDEWMDWYTWALPVDVAPPLRQAVSRLGDRWADVPYADFIGNMGRLKLPLEDWYDVRITRMTTERIRAVAETGRPFMVTCSFLSPHDPNVVPSPYYEMFDPAKIELPANRGVREERFEKEWGRRIVADLGEPGLREFLRIYYACVKMVDDQVGRILKTLDEAGLTDETIIVFTSDHGDMMGGHGMVWKSTSAFYDEIALVPLLIRYPRRLEPQQSELAVDLTDLMPTLMALLDRPIPGQVQGQNLVPLLTGRRDAAEARAYSFSERVRPHPKGLRDVRPGTKADLMIRGKGWKYIRFADGGEYLYHLAEDPGETKNLIGDAKYVQKRDELAAELAAWQERTAWPK